MPEVLSTASGGTQTEGTVSPNTDRPRPVNNIFMFFLLRFKSSRKYYFSLQPMCVEVGRARFDEARDRLQTKIKNKTLQHGFLLVIYVSQLSFLME